MAVLAMLASVLSACGGGSSSESISTNSAESEPSAAFAGKGPTAKLAKFGTEASDEEREQASEIVEASLEARENGDWTAQCETFSSGYAQQVASESTSGKRETCEKSLEGLASLIGQDRMSNTMTEPIAALRVKGNRGYAFYHGATEDFLIALEREDGKWKVASVAEERVY